MADFKLVVPSLLETRLLRHFTPTHPISDVSKFISYYPFSSTQFDFSQDDLTIPVLVPSVEANTSIFCGKASQ